MFDDTNARCRIIKLRRGQSTQLVEIEFHIALSLLNLLVNEPVT
jgi:hypothetical protein